MPEYIVSGVILAAFVVAGVLSYFFTPPVKQFAHKVGAIDVPKDNRRMHKEPIPRLGGLAIFGGFLASILIFGELDQTMLCVLLGASIIVALGIFDDVLALGAKLKFVVQIVAAAIPVCVGDLQIKLFTNLNPFSDTPYFHLGILAIPITIIWIVGITNAVNLIDGLDGLAVGVSSIAAITMLAVALLTGNMTIAVTMAALAGACIGFMPYNLNPAKIFMGDTGSTFLGYMLATVSIMGLFKFYAVISFAVPFLILGLPIFDTANAIIRRVAAGRSPMSPDRGHVHHKLIDMGFNQKQAVAILYAISATLGLTAVVLTSSGEVKAIVLLLAVLAAILVGACIIYGAEHWAKHPTEHEEIPHEEQDLNQTAQSTEVENTVPEDKEYEQD
ncbi:MraY family glycosyltransferase [Agathobaculum sp. Marseille-P7918]|uniref:MraY family glycosyltransferase n=1 Tax=Agathobaculum sp. Marseille-P7918 TaxID=2479843 RepID=UPI0035656142